MTNYVHVVPHPSGWAVRIEGNERVSSVHDTQMQAATAGRERAKRDGVELLVHGKNGQIRERNSYCVDPYPPQG